MKLHSSIVQCIANHALKTPDKPALADEHKFYTYGTLWTEIQALAIRLRTCGVNKDKCVVVECNQTADYMIHELAIQLLGGIFVPLEKNAAQSRVDEIIRETEAVLYIKKEELTLDKDRDYAKKGAAENGQAARQNGPCAAESGQAARQNGLCAAESGQAAGQSQPASEESWTFPDKSDVAEILFSTGTTGKSKGIVLTHGNDMALAENVMEGVQMKENNVELVPMPLSHSHGLRRTYANLVKGNCVVFVDGVTLLKKVFDLMDKYGVTAIDLSPSMLSIIFKLSKDRLGDYADVLDYIQLGSAPLAEEDKVHLSRILPKTRLYNFYGSTEAGCSCLLDFNSMSGKPGCIGRPAVNAHFIVVDENRKEIKSSKENTGFLASSGSINMKCYFKAPELTAETMADGYIYTKDLGYIDEEGLIYMLGRKDDVINYGGIKISPEEIESLVVKNQYVADCACIPVKDPLTGQAPKLFIVWKSDEDYDAKKFKAFLTESLDANKQPKYVELIEKIPRTFNGKIKRKLLMEGDN